MIGLRLHRLPRLRPRPLTDAEVSAIRRRPWPRLPVWLWATVLVTTAVMVSMAVSLLSAPGPDQPALGARRSPPAGSMSHGVGPYRAPALEPANRDRVERQHPTCQRLGALTLVGTPDQVALLGQAAETICGLRSTPDIDRARRALQQARATVAFAGFTASGNESTVVLGPPGAVTVLVNGKFAIGGPERVAVLLVHEGAHVADGVPPTAEAELAARRAELDACRRLFPGWTAASPKPNRGCLDAEALLSSPDPGAELRKAGYR